MRLYTGLAFTSVSVCFALLGTSPIQADFVTKTVSTSSQGTPTDFSVALSVATFDRSLGTLEGVTISYTDSAIMQGSVENTAPRTESFEVAENSTFTLSLYGQNLLSNTLGAQANFPNLASHEIGTFGAFKPSGSAGPDSITSGTLFNDFESSSPSIAFDFSSLTSTTTVGGGGNISTSISTTAFATLSVTYEYISPTIAVPEPTSLILTTAGVLGVAASLLWKKSRRERGEIRSLAARVEILGEIP